MRGTSIKKQEIISAISSISESLSVSDKQEFIVETALDSLMETLDIHCSWIQLSGQSGTNPYLASQRNFTEDILHDMTHMDKAHPLFLEVLGMGNRIVIPDLSLDGAYGMSAFEKAGFCSLVAVPITTYKVLGILGAADKKKRRFGNDIAQLLSTIASLVGVSLTKTGIAQKSLPEKNRSPMPSEPLETHVAPVTEYDDVVFSENVRPVDIEADPETEIEHRSADNVITGRDATYHTGRGADGKTEAFIRHARKMGRFREQHK
jgi:transcriptional regulator with GAF, ATPase, and Fis domain